MDNRENKINWEEIISLYNTIKRLYALCEETDPEFNTNLQPLNEFRAALDHILRIIAIQELPDEYGTKDAVGESRKLYSHLKRALFDVCDMAAINYRNKIIDTLKDYSVEEIQGAIPSYYSEIRPRIEEISEEIASMRTEKRFSAKADEETVVIEYPIIIEELSGYSKKICKAVPSLVEIEGKGKREKRNMFITQWVIPIASILIGAIIAIIGILV